MNFIKVGIRIWFGIASLLGFLGGWILFAHSGKPAQSVQAPAINPSSSVNSPAAIPTLVPLQSLNNNEGSSQIQPLQPLQQPQQPSFNFMPSFRTRGS